MGNRASIIRKLKGQFDQLVIERDGGCLLCEHINGMFVAGWDVHEIHSRSHFGTTELADCIKPENMVLLCRWHHDLVQGNREWSDNIRAIMADRYGYEY